MSWDAPAHTDTFLEALEWFLARVKLTKDEWLELSERARRKAFTVANVAQADVIRDVWVALVRAIEEGITLAEFKKSVGAKLEKAWGDSVGDPGWRMETIYRTNIQMAYGSGRWRQMNHPDLARTRPYFMFDAIMDNRTSPICEALDGTVLPAKDKFWTTHTPPLHFNCRSVLRSLRKSQAEQRGITDRNAVDGVYADDGFGLAPTEDEWEPDMEKYPTEIQEQLEEKLDNNQ